MSKYFFDIVSEQHSTYDYQGCALEGPEQAFRLAELMALDLEVHSGDDARPGWSVKVRDAHGRQYYSVPVHCTGLMAA